MKIKTTTPDEIKSLWNPGGAPPRRLLHTHSLPLSLYQEPESRLTPYDVGGAPYWTPMLTYAKALSWAVGTSQEVWADREVYGASCHINTSTCSGAPGPPPVLTQLHLTVPLPVMQREKWLLLLATKYAGTPQWSFMKSHTVQFQEEITAGWFQGRNSLRAELVFSVRDVQGSRDI